MSDGGKGDKRRPTDDAAYAEGFERIWGESRRSVPASDGVPPESMGCSSIGRAAGSNPVTVAGSTPATPASYIDDATGREVGPDWWPGDAWPKGPER